MAAVPISGSGYWGSRITASGVKQHGTRGMKFHLENNGASVRKLMAQGKLRIEGGRFVRIG
jgi:hypothetical protein